VQSGFINADDDAIDNVIQVDAQGISELYRRAFIKNTNSNAFRKLLESLLRVTHTHTDTDTQPSADALTRDTETDTDMDTDTDKGTNAYTYTYAVTDTDTYTHTDTDTDTLTLTRTRTHLKETQVGRPATDILVLIRLVASLDLVCA
jgi:hypothetical protein